VEASERIVDVSVNFLNISSVSHDLIPVAVCMCGRFFH
jgi:hypothetical protein